MSKIDHYDFFVSYSRADNATGWISSFVEELLAEHRRFTGGRELTHFFDKNDIASGADWQHTLNHGIAHSKLFVAFISPNYFASEWCRKEWRAWIDTEIAKHILTAGVRPVYIVEVPGLTDGKLSEQDFSRQIADFLKISDSDRDKLLAETPHVVKHLRRRQMSHNLPSHDVHSFYTEGVETLRRDDLRQVLSKLAQDLDHHAELLARADASDYTIPPYNKNFSGRLDELLQLREWLDKDDRTGVIHGVHGLGGIGKTELAFTYAWGYASAYPGGRYLISCDGESSLREAILKQQDFKLRFADKISDEQRKNSDEHFAAILFHLGQRIEKLGHVLMLLDNVTDAALLSWEQTDVLTKLGPKLHMLATTRLSAPTSNNSVNENDDHKTTWISLDRLPDEDALDLLEKHRPFMNDEDRESAQNIVKQLDGFTLAIELTAAYLAAKNSTSYGRMNKCLNIDALEKMANSDVKLRRHNHERRLSAILKPILEELQPSERRFMEYAALLPPDQVPLPWLKELVTQDYPELLEEDQLENPWDEVWQSLEKLSLISRTKEDAPEPRIFRVHRLVQELTAKNFSPAFLEFLQFGIDRLIDNRCIRLQNTPHLHDNCWELKPLTALAYLWDTQNHHKTVGVMNFLGSRWLELFEFIEAEPLLRRSLEINETVLGSNHPNVAVDLDLLGSLLVSTNRLFEADEKLRRALSINEQYFGSEHIRVAKSNNSLASLLRQKNMLAESEQLLLRSLSIAEKCCEPNDYFIAVFLNNLAGIMRATNRLSEAEKLYRRALDIYENQSSSVHHDLAVHLNNLAIVLSCLNRFDEAKPYMQRALMIDEDRYGSNHPKVALRLSNHATALVRVAEKTAQVSELSIAKTIVKKALSEAVKLYRRALEINELYFEPAHPIIAGSLYNLAGVLFATHSLNESETMFQRAIKIYEQNFGAEHPSVIVCQDFLAKIVVSSAKKKKSSKINDIRGIDREINSSAAYSKFQIMQFNKVGRNDPCPCGSNKKHKKCCGA